MTSGRRSGMAIIENGLYELKDGHGWCRHGLVRTQHTETRGMIAVDTYWGDREAADWYPVSEVEHRLRFIIDLRRCRPSIRHEWEQYEDADRAYIPVGGGREQFLVAGDARPSPARQAAQLKAEIAHLQSEIEWDRRELARKERELAQLPASKDLR